MSDQELENHRELHRETGCHVWHPRRWLGVLLLVSGLGGMGIGFGAANLLAARSCRHAAAPAASLFPVPIAAQARHGRPAPVVRVHKHHGCEQPDRLPLAGR